MPNLTKRLIESSPVKEKDYFLFDDALPCFGIRIMPSGKRTYVVQYRAGIKVRRKSLGLHGIVKLEDAKARAMNMLAAVQSGGDPVGDKIKENSVPTVKDLAERFEAEHVALRLKPRTAEGYRRLLKKHILPRLGHLKVTEAKRSDIAAFHYALRAQPYDANRGLEVISKMFNLAEMWGLRPDGTNPRRHIRKYPERKRERYLTPDETKRLGQTLNALEDQGVDYLAAVFAIKLLIYTGCRLASPDKIR